MDQDLEVKIFWRWIKNLEAIWGWIGKEKYARDIPPK
jgi:hypothetical protein